MNDPQVVALPARVSDADLAKSLKDRMTDLVTAVAALHQEAAGNNMRIEAQLGPNNFGRWVVQHVSVIKVVA